MMGDWHGGGMMGGMAGMWLLYGLFWLAVIVTVVMVARGLRRPEDGGRSNSAREILERRYASGEIDRETFERMKHELAGGGRRRPGGPLFLWGLLLVALLAGFMFLPASCHSMSGMMGPGGMHGMMGGSSGQMPPGIDPAALPVPDSRGARLLVRYCSQCHGVPAPSMHTAQDWPAVVERMNGRMQRMAERGMMMRRMAAPTHGELDEIVAYLQGHARQPLDRSRYGDLDSEAGRAFQQVCAQCHGLPDPGQHSAGEWPAVVARMKQNMITMGRQVPDEDTLAQIVAFLQNHARETSQ